ncbi:MAG: DsbA family oxidoreductase [Actinomycetaceae bacterium]|nr:DsbA family oxidoreductase [Actinomycetaceae bacterium]
MHIDIWSAIDCPWSYLGVRHLRQALGRFPHQADTTVRLHAYLLNPELDTARPESEAEYLATSKGMKQTEVEAALTALSDMGASEGIRFDWDAVVVAGTTNAHRLVCMARDIDMEADSTSGPDTLELRMHEALQRARFEMGADLSNPETLIHIAQDFGVDGARAAAALESQEYAGQVFSDFQIGVQMGVNAVPVFLFDNQFILEGSQPAKAFDNVLATAWSHRPQPGSEDAK